MTLDHALNASATRVAKHAERSVPGILLTYSRDGTLHDRRRPGWVCHVPEYHLKRPIITPHVTILEYIRPSPSRLRALLHHHTDASVRVPVSVRVDDDGTPYPAPAHAVPDDASDLEGASTPPPPSGAPARRALVPTPVTATIASRLPARVYGSRAGSSSDTSASMTSPPPLPPPPAPPPLPPLPASDLAASDRPSRSRFAPTRLTTIHDQQSGTVAEVGGNELPQSGAPALTLLDEPVLLLDCDHGSFDPACPIQPYSVEKRPGVWVDAPPRLPPSLPVEDAHVYVSAEVSTQDTLLCLPGAEQQVSRRVTSSVPDRTVRFPWGDVPYAWAAGYDNEIMFHTEVDACVDHDVLVSLEADDDPSYHAAMNGPDRQMWYDAREDEIGALHRLGVVENIPADSVPSDADIYDTMLLCKKKRGKDNIVLKGKMRCVLCGNQQVAASARRAAVLNDGTAPLRTHSPTIRHLTYKLTAGAGVSRGMRRRGFDVKWAYLQGDGKFMGEKVYARAPVDCRQYDERGVEYVWHVVRPLYGGPDSGRAWYLTFATWVVDTEGFVRCDQDACLFDRVFDDGRINLNLYVDDGTTWDSNESECDSFYERLARRFSITIDDGVFFLGMDHVDYECGALKLSSATYIKSLCHRELPRPLAEYKDMQVCADPRLMEFYETAFQLHVTPSREFNSRYRGIVGGLGWVAPTTRPDILHTVGIYQRAYTFSTDDLYGCAVQTLVYLGQTAEMGLTFSAAAPDARMLRAAVDSDWSVRRSTSGGALLLAGAAAHAVSRRQDCSAESSTAAEIIAASTFVGDIRYGVHILEFIGLPQTEPVRVDLDSKPAADVAQDYSASNKTKHLARRDFRIREAVFTFLITIRRVASADNVADLMTKVFTQQTFHRLRSWVLGTAVRSMTSVAALLVSAARIKT